MLKRHLQNRWVRRTLYGVGVLAVFGLGLGIGLSDDQATKIADLEDEVAELQAELTDVEEERDLAEANRDDTLAQLDETQADLRRARNAAGRATRRADRVRNRLADAEQPAADSVSSDGTHTVGQFTISDVQVREDFVNDFEVRARVTNNGDAAEFVSVEATLFNEGSVVASLDAYEDFDAGQTRTVTLTGTDDYGPWDDIEFSVDVGF